MTRSSKNFIESLYEKIGKNTEIDVRPINKFDKQLAIMYLPQLTDNEMLSMGIISPILKYGNKMVTIDEIAYSMISVGSIFIEDDMEKILDHVLNGKSVVALESERCYIVADTKKVAKRSIESPELQSALKSPKDSFNEDIESNISLIRHRIKDPSLIVDRYIVGRRTKTDIAVVYIEDIANTGMVKHIKKVIENIKIDGILETGYIRKILQDESPSFFPQAGIAERSDAASANILEGKICVIVDGSNLVLILPQVFVEFMDSSDDHYENIYFAAFTKLLRYFAIITSISLSAFYVAVVAFHPDILPAQYILAIAASRTTVPVNAFFEAMTMEFVTELLREASIRLPKQIGPAIGIVGTIVIGQAAVAAGLVSPLMVIIISLSAMSSFAIPDFTIINPLRVFKFFIIIITGIFGLLGLMMGLTILTVSLMSTTSLGVPYTAPISPLNLRDLKKYITSDIRMSHKRPGYLDTKDKSKQ